MTVSTDVSATDTTGKDNPITSVQNVMGFLLTTVGTVFSFIGITSSEVTAVLRNEPEIAAAVALILLLGVLAAALAVVLGSQRAVASPLDLVLLIFLLLGIGAFIVYAIPIKNTEGWILALGSWVSGVAFLVLLLVLLCFDTSDREKGRTGTPPATAPTGPPPPPAGQPVDEAVSPPADEPTTAGARLRGRLATFWNYLRTRDLPVQVVLIAASVILIAISMDGALRLETYSQLQTEVQVATSFSGSDSAKVLSVHVTAAKIKEGSWVEVDIYSANPSKDGPSKTHDIAQASIGPDTNGSVDDTFDVPLPAKKPSNIGIQASTCSSSKPSTTADCAGTPSQLTIPNPAAT
jgi:hypothetical protein